MRKINTMRIIEKLSNWNMGRCITIKESVWGAKEQKKQFKLFSICLRKKKATP